MSSTCWMMTTTTMWRKRLTKEQSESATPPSGPSLPSLRPPTVSSTSGSSNAPGSWTAGGGEGDQEPILIWGLIKHCSVGRFGTVFSPMSVLLVQVCWTTSSQAEMFLAGVLWAFYDVLLIFAVLFALKSLENTAGQITSSTGKCTCPPQPFLTGVAILVYFGNNVLTEP